MRALSFHERTFGLCFAFSIAIVDVSGCYELPAVGGGNGGTNGSTSSSDSSSSTDSSSSSSSSTGSGGNGGSPTFFSGCPSGIKRSPQINQALPQEIVDTAYVVPNGTVRIVKGGDNLQAVIDAAVPGDIIEIAPGGVFTGPYTLPNKTGDAWITIRTATIDESLPSEGTRISPADAPNLPKLVVPSGAGPVLTFAPGAHHYRLLGLEITALNGNYVTELVDIGRNVTTATDLPHHIVIDRSYLHGDAIAGARRGIALGGTHIGIVDSYFADFKEVNVEANAITGWNGPGPYKIVNNYLAAAGGSISFGAPLAYLKDNIPSDIEICRNHFHKPLAWQSESWFVRHHFEIVNAQRVVFAGNVLENNWANSNTGFAMILTPHAEGGVVPGVVHDLTITLNHVVHSGSAITLWGDDNGMAGGSKKIVINNNLFEDINGPAPNGGGRILQLLTAQLVIEGLEISHNTAPLVGNAFLTMGDTGVVASNFFFRDNLLARGYYGAFGSDKGQGSVALDFYVPGGTFTKNAIFGTDTGDTYPMGNFFPPDAAAVGFVDFAGGNFALAPGSSYANVASDGGAIGVDMTALQTAIAGVVK